ncbi:hypothetical protein AALO_G00010760 [Alosa alosa]|uniref:Uncharacterized protein n=1 Tax=Alosa alosa TaxID=278164 RepID=A0AAV6HFG7_9TELE|nr:hypothetical protein AALO_G00010760 [Alosa alosa]
MHSRPLGGGVIEPRLQLEQFTFLRSTLFPLREVPAIPLKDHCLQITFYSDGETWKCQWNSSSSGKAEIHLEIHLKS